MKVHNTYYRLILICKTNSSVQLVYLLAAIRKDWTEGLNWTAWVTEGQMLHGNPTLSFQESPELVLFLLCLLAVNPSDGSSTDLPALWASVTIHGAAARNKLGGQQKESWTENLNQHQLKLKCRSFFFLRTQSCNWKSNGSQWLYSLTFLIVS